MPRWQPCRPRRPKKTPAMRRRSRKPKRGRCSEFVESKVFAAARPEGQNGGRGSEVTLRKAIEASLPHVASSFRGQPLIEARLRQTLGGSFWYLGQYRIAKEQFETARALYAKFRGPDHRDTLKSMNNLATSYAALGRYAEALKLHEETLALRKATLGPDHPDTLTSMHNLANDYLHLGRARRGAQAPRRDPDAAKSHARPRPPRHAHAA